MSCQGHELKSTLPVFNDMFVCFLPFSVEPSSLSLPGPLVGDQCSQEPGEAPIFI